jgi:diacylglycerol kinase
MARLAMPKKDSNWDKDSFQGKRKDQVDYAAMSVVIAMIGIVLTLLIALIDHLWK